MPLKAKPLRSREYPIKIRKALFYTALMLIARFRPCNFPYIANHHTFRQRKNIVILQRTRLPLHKNICRRVIPAMGGHQRISRRLNLVSHRALRLGPIDNPSRIIAIPQHRRILNLKSSLQRFVILRNALKAGFRRIFPLPNTTITRHLRIHPVTNWFHYRRRTINRIINRQICQMMITASARSKMFNSYGIAQAISISGNNR